MKLAALALALAFVPTALSDPPPEGPKVLLVELDGAVGSELGQDGARAFRGAGEWTAFGERLNALGWREAEKSPLAGVDFATSMVVAVFRTGVEWNPFALRAVSGEGAERASVDVAMRYPEVWKEMHPPPPVRWYLLATVVPRASTVDVAVSQYVRGDSEGAATVETARRVWAFRHGEGGGDVVAGLRAELRVDAPAVKPGEDIVAHLVLRHCDASLTPPGDFARASRQPQRVWDHTYSNGYRNDAYLVTTPDGSSRILRRAVVLDWDKNIPHLCEIAHGRSYSVRGWDAGAAGCSLAGLGLDTKAPGTYRITAMYLESYSKDDGGQAAWAGELYSNSVEVVVK